MKNAIRVMLVEDSREYREVIALALEDEPDIELTSQFGTAEIALRNLQNGPVRATTDLVLLDLRLPGIDGLEAMPWFREYAPNAKIIVLTQSNAEADVLQAIKLGASGYLLKSSTVTQIKDGIRTVMDGGASLDAGVARFVLQTLKTSIPESEPQRALSEREMEILSLLAEGLVKKEIADRLDIGFATVATHIAHIYEKLEVHNAPAAVDRAHRLGLFKSKADPTA